MAVLNRGTDSNGFLGFIGSMMSFLFDLLFGWLR